MESDKSSEHQEARGKIARAFLHSISFLFVLYPTHHHVSGHPVRKSLQLEITKCVIQCLWVEASILFLPTSLGRRSALLHLRLFIMDRPARFSSRESKYYAASVQRSDTPGDTSDSSIQSAQGFQTIDLRDLNEWLQKSQSERRPLPPLQPRWQEMRETGDTFPTKRSPSFTVEEPKDPAPEYNEYFTKKPAPQFDQNFLHPPTPNRDSFAGIGMAAMRNQEDEHDTARLHPRRLSVNMERSSRFGWWTLCLLIITIIMVTLSAFYSNGSTKSFWQDRFFTTSASNAILILRIMTEACALLLAALVMVVVEDLQWALASRPQGVDLLHFIGMDSGTGVWGLLRLLATADWKQKYSSLFRWVPKFKNKIKTRWGFK